MLTSSSMRNSRASASLTRPSRGFTLLELLIVVVIIGLLAAYVGPKYFAQLGKSERTIAKAQIEALGKALDTYRLDVGRYPSSEEGLAALVTKPPSATQWNGPYLQKSIPMDPWGHPYQYRSPGATSEIELLSYGKDGQPGGAGENADISN
ncbi:MAG: type secretion system protein GspG [Herbaspirillum sp.]|nr:type secretion system protein GspG [Herbaspirillum sp.]